MAMMQDYIPLLPADIVIVRRDEKYLFLNPSNPSWLVTNRNGAIALRLCDGVSTYRSIADRVSELAGRDARSEVQGFLQEASDLGIFETQGEPAVYNTSTLTNIHLNMTEDCNLGCIYCYATDRGVSQETLDYDDLLQIVSSAKHLSSNCTLTFTGGEPLISNHTIPLALAAKKSGLSTYLLTNGTLIDERNADEITSAFDRVKISLDGSSAHIHESLRGEGTFEPTVNAIRLLKSRGVELLVSMTVTGLNIQDIANMVMAYGSLLTFAPLFPLGRARCNDDLSIAGDQYYAALHDIAGINPCVDILNALSSNNQRKSFKCSMGDGSISIAANGDVYPCHLLHYPQFNAGNLRTQSLEDIYRTSEQLNRHKVHTVENIEGCKDCGLRFICGGGCQGRHFCETGSLDQAGPFCSYEKASIINGLFDLYAFRSQNR